MYISLTPTDGCYESISEPKYKTLGVGWIVECLLIYPKFLFFIQLTVMLTHPSPFSTAGVASNRRTGYFGNI